MAEASLPGNPIAGRRRACDTDIIADAILALAFEQRQRNRLAAITAVEKGFELPEDMLVLLKGYAPEDQEGRP